MSLDIDAIAARSRARVVASLPRSEWACPFCERELSVRRTQIGWIATDDNRAYIDGVQAKCAGDGCGFRPDFDVPIREGRGHWSTLTGREEFERERELRDGARGVDIALDGDADPETTVRSQLQHLGYLE